jgi:HK97 family phage major capsid protein
MTDAMIDQLAARRDAARAEADEILARATGDLAGPDAARFGELTTEIDRFNTRIDELTGEALRRANSAAVLERAAGGRRLTRGPLGAEAADTARAFRSAIHARNPAPIEVYPTRAAGGDWPDDLPAIQTRCGAVRMHTGPTLTRDLTTGTPTGLVPTDVYDQIVSHLVESTGILKAGATVLSTDTGEELQIPRSTAFMSSAIVPEGTPIPESDPALSVVTLKSYKYASLFQVSYELANDTPTDLLGFLATAAAESLAQAFGDDLINGDGNGKPTGLLSTISVGLVGPVGTSTDLGAQGTPGQGTDALWNLVGSVAEPYASAPAAGFLMRNPTDVGIRRLKDTTGQPVTGLGERGRILGYPSTLDGFMPYTAPGAHSIVFGDFSRFFVRIAGPVRFERSDEFAFDADLVTFRAAIRLDGAQVDTAALAAFENSAT